MVDDYVYMAYEDRAQRGWQELVARSMLTSVESQT